jgi:aspartate/methionine/tyrosine aminotransferase
VFSSRLPAALGPNALTRALARLRDSGESWLDLTETNPTAVGLPYPAGLLRPLADPAGMRYRPRPLGLDAARTAIATEYAGLGTPVASDRIVLTASTSEAYAILFKLLCNPGDTVLVPQPSYPLFDLLTRLDGVAARPYRLEYHGAWSIDRASVDAAMSARTRAILLVSPNNPTGSLLRATDRAWLVELCAERELALIADEVFGDYLLSPRPDAVRAICGGPALTFALGGLSKSAGLPQVKIGWSAVDGPSRRVRDALQRLEIICDTYLSVSTPLQMAVPALIDAGRSIRASIAARLQRNLDYLRGAVGRQAAVSLLEPEGGWSAVVRVPATESEEALVLRLLDQARVLAHPGYFFDFATEAYLVLSLLPEVAIFSKAIDRLLPVVSGDAS